MQPLSNNSRRLAALSQDPPAPPWLQEGAPRTTGAPSARRVDQGVEIRWQPPATAFAPPASASIAVDVKGRGPVPFLLEWRDGPSLRVVYEHTVPPADFDNFRVYVTLPGQPRIELGGMTTPEGHMAFVSTSLAARWPDGSRGDCVIFVAGV